MSDFMERIRIAIEVRRATRRARQRRETQGPRSGWLPTDDVIERDYEEILGHTDPPIEEETK